MSRLDQFYTDRSVAAQCFRSMRGFLARAAVDAYYIEPSAGDGAFVELLPPNRVAAVDLAPRRYGVEAGDFLFWEPGGAVGRVPPEQRVTLGNPPFGKRGALAVNFFNHAATLSDTIGFIAPVIFRKHFIHKQLADDMRLVVQDELPDRSFRLPNGRPRHVNAEFQIWTRLPTAVGVDYRRRSPPPTKHKDFILRQYNNTKEALKVFGERFDLAVPCQGWQDYTRRESAADRCEKNKQWMLFTAAAAVIERIAAFDFARLARSCATSVPGFRMGDFVEAYSERYGA